MKAIGYVFFAILGFTSWASCGRKSQGNFKAQRVSKSAEITINGNISRVYPLFGAFEERKVDDGWNPILIYPDQEIIEEGTTFKTIQQAHQHAGSGEQEFLWRVIKYEPAQYLIQYLVSTPNRFWTVTVKCEALEQEKTKATITYTYTGLNDQGNKLNQLALAAMYKHNLKDWEEGFNYYLKTGKAINAPK